MIFLSTNREILFLFSSLFFFFLLAIFWMRRSIKISQRNLTQSFKGLSYDAMEQNNRVFLDLAKTVFDNYQQGAKGDLETRQKAIESLITPLKESLEKVEKEQQELERRRVGAYASLHKQLESLVESENLLRGETANLAKALKSPNIRGAWGQIHLRRVVELAGLLHKCDFTEQNTIEKEGKTWRPDLVVHLPGNRQIIVDAKTPIDAYIESFETQDERVQKEKLKTHSLHLRKHIRDLSSKQYWKHLNLSPEYVILFLPAEAFFSAALQVDPMLIELGANENIILASPTTLIAVLRAVAYGWKQHSLSESAQEIAHLGKELYERLGVMSEYWSRLGKNLSQSVDVYNQAISSFESRVLVSARKFKELGAGTDNEKLEIEQVEKLVKKVKME